MRISQAASDIFLAWQRSEGSGDRLAIAAYLGAGSSFERAIARFSAAYADQNDRDHRRLAEAVSSGEVVAQAGV